MLVVITVPIHLLALHVVMVVGRNVVTTQHLPHAQHVVMAVVKHVVMIVQAVVTGSVIMVV